MIFDELLYAFRNDLEIEYLKRNIGEGSKIRFNQKQLKLIFSKVVSDLQKEFKIIQSEQTISTLAGESSYALTRDFMSRIDAFYETKKLEYVPMNKIHDGITASSIPTQYGIKWVNAYPYIVVNPAPADAAKSIVVKSYNDMKLFSINDGLDTKSNEALDTKYLKIPTQYDAAILLGMMSEIFDDKIAKYEREKLRLRSLRSCEYSLNEYDMTGVNDEFPKTTTNYNSDADATPSVLPADPT